MGAALAAPFEDAPVLVEERGLVNCTTTICFCSTGTAFCPAWDVTGSTGPLVESWDCPYHAVGPC